MDQSKLMKARVVRINTATARTDPTDGTTEPQITLSPNTPQGTPTMGFFFGVKAPTVETPPSLVAGNISLVLWIRNPVTKQWFSSSSFLVEYGQGFTCYDVNAAELFFRFVDGYLATDGILHFHIGEL